MRILLFPPCNVTTSSPPPDGNVIPLHAVPTQLGERIERKPGRPRKVRLAPTASENQYQDTMNRLREAALATDPILAAHSSEETVRCVIEQLASEAASLLWEREQAQDRGLESAAQLSSRRVDALSKLANVVVAAHRLGVYGNDPSPEKLKMVLNQWMKTISDVTYEILPAEDACSFMTRYEAVISEIDLAALMSE